MAVVYGTMGTLCILLFLAAQPVVGLFGLTPGAARMAVELLRWYAVFSLIFWPASFSLPNALRAANDVKFTMWVGVGSMILFRVVVSWFLCVQFQMGAIGVWIAMILDWVCRISFFLPRIFSGKWQTKYTAG